VMEELEMFFDTKFEIIIFGGKKNEGKSACNLWPYLYHRRMFFSGLGNEFITRKRTYTTRNTFKTIILRVCFQYLAEFVLTCTFHVNVFKQNKNTFVEPIQIKI